MILRFYPFRQHSFYKMMQEFGSGNIFFSLFLMSIQWLLLIIILQIHDLNVEHSFNIVSYCLCCLSALYVLVMMLLYLKEAFSKEIINNDYSSKKQINTLSLFHKMPMIRDTATKNYGTLWMFYKLIIVLFLYYDLKYAAICLSFLNPISMVVMDIWQFHRLWKYHKFKLDKLYCSFHFVVDVLLLLNGCLALLLEQASLSTLSSQWVSRFDTLYQLGRIYLIFYLVFKFVVLLAEVQVYRNRTNNILKCSQYLYYC